MTQEAELRTLKESLDVRNKKIIQLEGQISHAARHIAERPSDQVSHAEYHNSSASVASSLATLHSKLDTLLKMSCIPVNNININNNPSGSSNTSSSKLEDKTTQIPDNSILEESPAISPCNPASLPTLSTFSDDLCTPPVLEPMEEGTEAVLMCTTCGKTFQTDKQLDEHIEGTHGQTNVICNTAHGCDKCPIRFKTLGELKEHLETTHVQNLLNCASCDYKCKTQSHLNYHMVSCHDSITAVTVHTVPPPASAPSSSYNSVQPASL